MASKSKLFLLCAMIGSISASFKESKEQERQHLEKLYSNDPVSLKKVLICKSVLNESSISLQEIRKNLLEQNADSNIIQLVLDLEITFEQLKKIMNIPDEVDIRYFPNNCTEKIENILQKYSLSKEEKDDCVVTISNFHQDFLQRCNAFYYVDHRIVYVLDTYFSCNPSGRLFCLIHELTHCKQHMEYGFLHMYGSTLNLEYEADTSAACAIQCPLCFKVICASFPRESSRKQMGYLTHDDITNICKSKNDKLLLCHAHKNSSLQIHELTNLIQEDAKFMNLYQKLVAWLFSEKFKRIVKIVDLDFQIGTMMDRLSTIDYRYIKQLPENITDQLFASWTKRLE